MTGVAGEDDARRERDLLAAQPVRVAAAVPALVRRADDGRDGAQVRDARDDALAGHGVIGDQGRLLVGERRRGPQHGPRHARLADVVQDGRVPQQAQVRVAQAHPPAHDLGHPRDQPAVVGRVPVLGLDGARQGRHRGEVAALETLEHLGVLGDQRQLAGEGREQRQILRVEAPVVGEDDERPGSPAGAREGGGGEAPARPSPSASPSPS